MAEHTIDRRRLLQLAAAAAVPGWGARRASAQPRWSAEPFTLGVASGSPAADSVVLWTRLAAVPGEAGALPVQWEVAHDEQFARVAQRGTATAAPELAHAVHVEAQGLEPDRWYFYRFLAGGWASAVGRTRTLPAAGAAADRLRIAYASCQRWEHGHYAAWRHLRADHPDLVLFLGDYIYEYPGSLASVRPTDGGWVHSLAGYRRRHALYKSDADLQAAHAAAPWLVTWDDHEVQNDYAGAHAGNAGPPVADFAARRAAAYQAYYEHMPLRAHTFSRALGGGGALRLHSTQRFGRLAALHLLDGRQHRDAQACTPAGRAGSGTIDPATCPEWADPARSLLGAAQERWLAEQLARGGTQWSVLGQGTLFGQRLVRGGAHPLVWNDGWDGYPAARRRLTQALHDLRVPNPVLLGGDVHENWVGKVKLDYADPASTAVGVEFCGTSITSRPSNAAVDAVPRRLAGNPHFVYGEARYRGYGIADFTPQRLDVTLRAVEDAERADSGVRTLATFAVEAGRPRVERA